MRKLLVSALIGLIFIGVPVRAHLVPAEIRYQAKIERETSSVAGTVTSVATDGSSFAIVSASDTKETLEFIIDKDTTVEGQLRVAAKVTVVYRAIEGGGNIALHVAAQA